MFRIERSHWPEFLIEAAGLAIVISSAAFWAIVLLHPGSSVARAIDNSLVSHLLVGAAAAATSMVLTYSPWGQQSGAHWNPAVTWTFCRLGRVATGDAVGYTLAQVSGALLALGAFESLAGEWLAWTGIHHLTTRPGAMGPVETWLAEFAVAFALMSVIIRVSNSRWARWTGCCAALIVACNAALIAPRLGTSLNPARTVSAATYAQSWHGIWIYLTATPLGMWAAARWFTWRRGSAAVFCAKLHHQNSRRCIFCESRRQPDSQASA